ncbi:MAG: hypothetical protein ACLVL7_02600 [Anaerotruncus massiliensis (ex Togo et al. 2019)]
MSFSRRGRGVALVGRTAPETTLLKLNGDYQQTSVLPAHGQERIFPARRRLSPRHR